MEVCLSVGAPMSHRIVNTSGAAIQVTENGAGEPSLFT